MPVKFHSLVGRQTELQRFEDASSVESWITVVGPGGVGKTSLVRAAFAERQHEWLQLGTCRTLDDVALAIGSHRDIAVEDAADTFVRRMFSRFGRDAVVCLDECELLEAAALLQLRTLADDLGLRVVATSRRPLDVEGEFVFRLSPLQRNEAAQLLTALVARSGGEPVDPKVAAEFADLVHGLPLALRLVASRIASLGAESVLRWFSGSRDSDVIASLRIVSERSIQILPATARGAFEVLSLFEGTIDTATAFRAIEGLGLDALDALHALVSHALLLRPDANHLNMFTWVRVLAAQQIPAERVPRAEEAWANALLKRDHKSVDERHAFARSYAADFQKLIRHANTDWAIGGLEIYQQVRHRSHPTEVIDHAEALIRRLPNGDPRLARLLVIALGATRTLAPELARQYSSLLAAELELHPNEEIEAIGKFHQLRLVEGRGDLEQQCRRLLVSTKLSDEIRAQTLLMYAVAARPEENSARARIEEACHLFRAVGSTAGQRRSLATLAENSIERGEYGKALEQVAQALQLGPEGPGSVTLHYVHAAAHYLVGDVEAAKQLLDHAFLDAEAPRVRTLCLLRGFVLWSFGAHGDAREAFDAAQATSGGGILVLDCVNALGFALAADDPQPWRDRVVALAADPSMPLAGEIATCANALFDVLGLPAPPPLRVLAKAPVQDSILRVALHSLSRSAETWLAADGTLLSCVGERYEFAEDSPTARVLAALAQAKGPVEGFDLVEAGWPGETFGGTTGLDRLRVMISRLRKLGLGDAIERTPNSGYALAPKVRVRPRTFR